MCTPSLIWNKKDNLVKTDSYVRVVSEEGDVLQGQGFVSDAHMDNWRILSNVTGIFQDAARRLKEEDKTQAKEIESRDSAQTVRSSSSVAAKVATPVAKSSSATASKPAKATPDAPATKQDSLAEKARRNALNAIRGTVLRPKAKTRNE